MKKNREDEADDEPPSGRMLGLIVGADTLTRDGTVEGDAGALGNYAGDATGH